MQLCVIRALAMSVTHLLPRSAMWLSPLLLRRCFLLLSRLGCLHRALLGLGMLRALLMRSRRMTGSLTARHLRTAQQLQTAMAPNPVMQPPHKQASQQLRASA